MIKTPVCDMLGIKYPVFQGGMAWVSDASLASAVSNAGGLGVIAAMNMDGSYLEDEIDRCRELLDDASIPFGVNIMLMSPFADEVAGTVIEKQVPVVITGAGMPSKYIKDWVAAGIKVIPVVPSTAIARMVERMGAMAVIAEGGESGGHVGDLTTMTLVPQVADAVDVPIIAAGGIADGRGVAAALMLGAQGVQCGTRFLTAYECTVHKNYKKKIIDAKDIDTVVTGRRLGHPVRALRNQFCNKFKELEYDTSITIEEIERFGAGSLRRAAKDGDVVEGSVMAGQCASMVKDEKSAKEIIESMFQQAEMVLKQSAGLLLEQ